MKASDAEIRELLAYILVYAPDFPPEDHTDLAGEFGKLRALLQSRLAGVADSAAKQSLQLAAQELEVAFEAFSRGDEATAAREMQNAERHFNDFVGAKKGTPRFIASSNGAIEDRVDQNKGCGGD